MNNFNDLHTTSILASLCADENDGASADTSHLKSPLVFKFTFFSTTFLLSERDI